VSGAKSASAQKRNAMSHVMTAGTEIPPSHDDEGYEIVGRVITTWSMLHDTLRSRINMMQNQIRVRQIRASGKYLLNPGPHAYHTPEKRFRIRTRYYRLLVRVLAGTDAEIVSRAASLCNDLRPLYEVRNYFAHGVVSISSRWDAPSFRLTSWDWYDDYSRNISKYFDKGTKRKHSIAPKRPRPMIYTFEEVGAFIDKMVASIREFDAIHFHLSAIEGSPVDFPEPPT
jgi:hypothetical protein